MGKAAKSKREEAAAAKEAEEYTFKIPHFDEKAFIKRELLGARASFVTLGVGVGAGLLSVLLYILPVGWGLGWLPILAGLVFLRRILRAVGFPEDVTTWKALFGSLFMLFFTGLAVWILGVNIVS